MRLHFYNRLNLFFLLSELLFLSVLFYLFVISTDLGRYPDPWILWLLLSSCWLLLLLIGRYQLNRQLTFWGNIKKLLQGIAYFTLITSSILMVSDLLPAQTFLMFLLSFSGIVLVWRTTFHYIIINHRKGYNLRSFVIVGYSKEGRYLANYFVSHDDLNAYIFKGYFDTDTKDPRVKGNINDLLNYIQDQKLHTIYWCLPTTHGQDLEQVLNLANQHLIKVYIVPSMMQFYGKSMRLYKYGVLPILDISYAPLDDEVNMWMKRSFDILFSLSVILFLLSWMIPLFGLLIKLSSRGPIFFVQKRHGRLNTIFHCYKFRTMRVAPKNRNVKQAMRKDPRVTILGRWMRKTSIDELPQFLNVFLGKMSVVGPRPHEVSMNEEFSKMIDQFWMRHRVKPGITGLAQSKGYRGECITTHDLRGRVHLDKFYVKNWSMLWDIQIILSTIHSLSKHRDKSY